MERLLRIQEKLKVAKEQSNDFGKYKYRSLEDILEEVKPLLAEEKLTMIMTDTVKYIEGRFYVVATATIYDGSEKLISTTAYARESETKKGMDASQITGSSSSYARKYCLSALFLIDNTKDADTMDNRDEGERVSQSVIDAKIKTLDVNAEELYKQYGVTSYDELSDKQTLDIDLKLTKELKKREK